MLNETSAATTQPGWRATHAATASPSAAWRAFTRRSRSLPGDRGTISRLTPTFAATERSARSDSRSTSPCSSRDTREVEIPDSAARSLCLKRRFRRAALSARPRRRSSIRHRMRRQPKCALIRRLAGRGGRGEARTATGHGPRGAGHGTRATRRWPRDTGHVPLATPTATCRAAFGGNKRSGRGLARPDLGEMRGQVWNAVRPPRRPTRRPPRHTFGPQPAATIARRPPRAGRRPVRLPPRPRPPGDPPPGPRP